MSRPVYRIKHVGINTGGNDEAMALADVLCRIFCQEPGENKDTGVFAGSLFEVMKHSKRGKHGHIALQTEDVEAAMADLASKGITFQEDTIRRDENGKIKFVYLQQDFGGFSFHLTT